jgi:hypothetical protein
LKSEDVGKIVEMLDEVRKRPKMYFGHDDNVEATKCFLHGFELASQCVGIQPSSQDWEDIFCKRRIRIDRRLGLAGALRRRGYIELEVVRAMLEIQADVWRTCYNRLRASEDAARSADPPADPDAEAR